jgi:hypothetical protein
MFNTISGPGAVRARAALRYGSGSDQMMRLLAAPAPQRLCLQHMLTFFPSPLIEFFRIRIYCIKKFQILSDSDPQHC